MEPRAREAVSLYPPIVCYKWLVQEMTKWASVSFEEYLFSSFVVFRCEIIFNPCSFSRWYIYNWFINHKAKTPKNVYSITKFSRGRQVMCACMSRGWLMQVLSSSPIHIFENFGQRSKTYFFYFHIRSKKWHFVVDIFCLSIFYSIFKRCFQIIQKVYRKYA